VVFAITTRSLGDLSGATYAIPAFLARPAASPAGRKLLGLAVGDSMKKALASTQSMCVHFAMLLTIALLEACSAQPNVPTLATTLPHGSTSLSPWRTVLGGFLAPSGPGLGLPARPGTSAFIKLRNPTAIALRGNDLLIVDSSVGRVWRADLALNTLTAITGAPATLSTMVALGPDLSAWVLDSASRQAMRFARDGRLLQTYRLASAMLSPVAFALADGGATLLVADDAQHQWVEYRGAGGFAIPVRPTSTGGNNILGVNGLAINVDTVYVLDRSAAIVHVVRRNGQVLTRLGEGDLKQPAALAADRFGRVFVFDAQDRAIKRLSLGQPSQLFDASQLGVQQIGGVAIDEQFLAVADSLVGQIVIHVMRDSQKP
jgi:hypothetical protein